MLEGELPGDGKLLDGLLEELLEDDELLEELEELLEELDELDDELDELDELDDELDDDGVLGMLDWD